MTVYRKEFMAQSLAEQIVTLTDYDTELSTETLFAIAPQFYKLLEAHPRDDTVTLKLKLQAAREFMMLVSARLVER